MKNKLPIATEYYINNSPDRFYKKHSDFITRLEGDKLNEILEIEEKYGRKRLCDELMDMEEYDNTMLCSSGSTHIDFDWGEDDIIHVIIFSSESSDTEFQEKEHVTDEELLVLKNNEKSYKRFWGKRA